MTIHALPPWVVLEFLLPLGKGDILHAQAVSRSWHTLTRDPTFLKKWLSHNQLSVAEASPSLHRFLVRHLFTNVKEILPLVKKAFSGIDWTKNTHFVRISVFFHSLHVEHSFQFIVHKKNKNPVFKCFTKNRRNTFFILPAAKTPHTYAPLYGRTFPIQSRLCTLYYPKTEELENDTQPLLQIVEALQSKNNATRTETMTTPKENHDPDNLSLP